MRVIHHWGTKTQTITGAITGGDGIGDDKYLKVTDFTSTGLLQSILIELKKLNLRQEAAFGETVNDGDV